MRRGAPTARTHGEDATASNEARAAWRAGLDATDAKAGDAETFLSVWGTDVTPDDDWARFRRLARLGTTAAAARTAARLDPMRAALARARLLLASGLVPDPLALRSALPDAARDDPELVLLVARALRRNGRLEAAAGFWSGIAAPVEAVADQRAAFWAERDQLARTLLANGDAARAFVIADDQVATPATARADALFLAGWIALRRLGRADLATTRFTALERVSGSIATRARAAYWLARAAQSQGATAPARHEFERAATFPTSFYGQRALAYLHPAVAPDGFFTVLRGRLDGLTMAPAPPADALAFASADMPRAAVLLIAWGQGRRARAFLDIADQRVEDPRLHAVAGRLALLLGLPEEAVTIARRAGRAGQAMPDIGWPEPVTLPARPSAPGLTAPLVLGLIRQESAFDPGAVSPSGALGLMQLLPGTAAEMARASAVGFRARALTVDPDLNMRLGMAYLARLLTREGGNVPFAVAAYNAGPHRAASWPPPPPSNGDDTMSDDMIDWIESIPVEETRNYVERVLENEAVYAARTTGPASRAMALAGAAATP